MKKFGMLFLVLTFVVVISCNPQDLIDRFVLENSQDRTELLEDGRMHVVLVGTGGPIVNDRRVSQCNAILAGPTVDSLTRLGMEREANMLNDTLEYQMDAVHVGEVAQEAGAGKVVLTHVVPPAPEILDRVFIDGVKEAYSGEVIIGEDGMFFSLDPKN